MTGEPTPQARYFLAHPDAQGALKQLDALTRGLLTDYLICGRSPELICARWNISMARFDELTKAGMATLSAKTSVPIPDPDDPSQ